MERRQFERLPFESLPETLKRFEIDLGAGRSITAETYDASTAGVGVRVGAGVGIWRGKRDLRRC